MKYEMHEILLLFRYPIWPWPRGTKSPSCKESAHNLLGDLVPLVTSSSLDGTVLCSQVKVKLHALYIDYFSLFSYFAGRKQESSLEFTESSLTDSHRKPTQSILSPISTEC